MGTLFYGAGRLAINVDDRLLTHLKTVILTRLRRHEPVILNWRDAVEMGDGRTTVWIDHSTDLLFHFVGSRRPELDRELLDDLATQANTSTGIDLGDAASLTAPPPH